MGTMEQFVKKHGIKFSYKQVDMNPYWSDGIPANHYQVTLRYGQRQYTTYYSMGLGLSREPAVEEVLNCLALDAAGIDNSRSFEDWAGEYGYDTDSIKAYKIYQACGKVVWRLKRLLGDEVYHELLWDTEQM